MTGFSTSNRAPNAERRTRRSLAQLSREGRPNSNFDVTTGINAVGTGHELDGIRFTTVDGNAVFIVGVSAELAMYRDSEAGSLIFYVDAVGARWTVNTLIETDITDEDVEAETCLELGDALTFRGSSTPATPGSGKLAVYSRYVPEDEELEQDEFQSLAVKFGDAQLKTIADTRRPSIASGLKVVRITAADSAYTCSDWDDVIEIDATSGAVTVYLPTMAGRTVNRLMRFKRMDSSGYAVQVLPTGSTIDGQSGLNIDGQMDCYTLMPGTAGWIIVSDYRRVEELVSLAIGSDVLLIGSDTLEVEQVA